MCSLRLTLMAAIVAASTAHAVPAPTSVMSSLDRISTGWVQLADARTYFHCHATRRLNLCHKRY
jgi:hypothetical protein